MEHNHPITSMLRDHIGRSRRRRRYVGYIYNIIQSLKDFLRMTILVLITVFAKKYILYFLALGIENSVRSKGFHVMHSSER